MDLINPTVEKYLNEIIPERDAVLTEMEEHAERKGFPIVGPLVGRLLYVIATSMKAKRVLELGSGFGYSAYWFAKAVGKDGTVICTDATEENHHLAQNFFKRGKVADRIEFHVGDALKLIDKFDGEFDIVFNDIEKANYPRALKKAVSKLRKGGLLVSDNALWYGNIFEKKPDAATAGILTYNRMVYASKELFTSIVPLRDGIAISIKI